MEKWEIRHPLPQKPWTDRHLNLHGWLRRGPLPHAKFHQVTITPFRPQIRENAPRVTRLVFRFFCQPTAKTPAPIFTNDVVSRKDVPFGGPKNKILHFDPILPKKRKFLANFWRDLENSRQKGHNNGDARE